MLSLGRGAIVWSNKKHPTIALSNIEAKYREAIVAAYEVIWKKHLLLDLGIKALSTTMIYWDNMGNIQLAKNPRFHAHTKHIEMHYDFIRVQVLGGDVNLVHVNTRQHFL